MSQQPIKFVYEEENTTLWDLWIIVWKAKWLILGLSIIGGLIGAFRAYRMPDIYRSEVLLSPIEEDKKGGGLQSLAAQYGGLAAMAGINLGGVSSSIETHIAILKSRLFLDEFIAKNEIIPLIYKSAKTDSGEPGTYDYTTRSKAYKKFSKGILKVSENNATGLISIGIVWTDPSLTAKWANRLVRELNEHLRLKAASEAKKSIEYLKQEIVKTSDNSMKTILYGLIEKQIQTITLAKIRDEYAFSVIDPAVAPLNPKGPDRIKIIVFGGLFGCMLAIGIQFCIVYIQTARNKKKKMENQ